MLRRIPWTLALSGCALATLPPAGAAPYAPQVGKRHSDFVLPTITDRTPVSLSQLRGKKVLLIHFASW